MTHCEPSSRDREKWNRRFRESGPGEPARRPSAWLVSHAELLERQPRGRALDLASGLGRNAFYLAERGFAVDAWDLSDVATEHVALEAGRRGLEVRARCCDLRQTCLPAGAFEVVLDCFYLQRDLFPAMAGALAPGGLLFFETPLAQHTGPGGRRLRPEHTLEPSELLAAFAGLEVIAYREQIRAGEAGSTWAVAQLVARRPAAPAT